MNYSGCWNGIAIVGGGILVALAVVALARRLFSPESLRHGHDALFGHRAGCGVGGVSGSDHGLERAFAFWPVGLLA